MAPNSISTEPSETRPKSSGSSRRPSTTNTTCRDQTRLPTTERPTRRRRRRLGSSSTARCLVPVRRAQVRCPRRSFLLASPDVRQATTTTTTTTTTRFMERGSSHRRRPEPAGVISDRRRSSSARRYDDAGRANDTPSAGGRRGRREFERSALDEDARRGPHPADVWSNTAADGRLRGAISGPSSGREAL